MTSNVTGHVASVWSWLSDSHSPILAGFVENATNGATKFAYAPGYLAEVDVSVPIYPDELPLRHGRIDPPEGLHIAGCLRDAAPDAWGRRVIRQRAGRDTELEEIDYLLACGSDRVGALDFTSSSEEHVSNDPSEASLEDLAQAARLVEGGFRGSTTLDYRVGVGGARPKALVDLDDGKWIAKFSLRGDHQNVVKAEYVAMRLAAECGLSVAPVRLERTTVSDVLLVERFDRVMIGDTWHRRGVVSVLTVLGLDEMMARYASYEDVAAYVRGRMSAPGKTLRELFGRMTFNILCGNTDDHARNHAMLWDGRSFSLSPAYDVCPQSRSGDIASQAMLIHGQDRSSSLQTCLEAATGFGLTQEEAVELIVGQVLTIGSKWRDVAEEAELTPEDKTPLAGRALLNPYCLEDVRDTCLREAYRNAAHELDQSTLGLR